MIREPLAHIALHAHADEVVADAVATARRLSGADAAFAAVANGSGAYGVTALEALSDPRWSRMRIRSGRGLGGKVLVERNPCLAADYLEEPTITGDYRAVVGAEGLRGMACVPVPGPDGVAALLYVSDRRVGAPGDRVVELMLRIADLTTVGLTLAARRAAALAGPPTPARLTARERDVLELLCRGASNHEIAERLVIAESTAKGHVRALIEKFGARSRLEVVARARGADHAS
jgi:DNA-binding CsgD family transcriptional regulator